jgi:hypothetical protein
VLTFDHMKLVRRDPQELKRFRQHLLGVQPGDARLQEFNVEHEHDDSCCRAEPWNVTLLTICLAVKPPAKLGFINLPYGA